LLSTLSILSLGFIIASRVPTSRFARPIVAASLYPMIALSGLFFPVAQLPVPFRMLAYALPTTHAVTLMQGIWDGSSWGALWVSVAALVLLFGAFAAISSKVFRWE
jgi:ABC-2 type transport system permease protein